jgi:ATP-dependent 26S proteasome regulatory subunit
LNTKQRTQKTPNPNLTFQRKTKESKILGEKISNILPSMKIGDVITVGKNIDTVSEGLRKTILQFDCAIKRVFHIIASIKVPMAITFDEDCEFKCVNIGDETFALVTSENNEEMPNKHIALDPSESFYLTENDTIVIGDDEIIITDVLDDYANSKDMNFELPTPNEIASQVYNFSEIQLSEIERSNLSVLNDLLKSSKSTSKSKKLSFKDVGGLDNVINKLKKGIVYPIEFSYAYADRDKTNKGFILYGPPGTGKTLLAQALANESNAHYIKLNGLEMASKWVGESEENWRKLFEAAKENQPAIIFIDEFDAVARSRRGEDVHGDKVVNQMLTLMDDVEKENQQVYVITATNKLEALDEAISRSGRFGEYIEVAAPNREGLEQIFNIHSRKKRLDKDFDKNKFLNDCASAKTTGADIAFIVEKAHEYSWERAGIYEKMENKTLKPEDVLNTSITQEDFKKAFELWNNQHNKNKRRPIGFSK